MRVGEIIRVKVGDLDPMPAQVRSMIQLDSQLQKVGLYYVK